MTWSIVARGEASRAFGIAVASRFFAVGAMCPYLASGAEALRTQSLFGGPSVADVVITREPGQMHPAADRRAVRANQGDRIA